MTTGKIPVALAVALLIVLPASILSAEAIACGHGVTCNWIEDLPTRGSFIVAHAGAVTVTEDPMKDQPHSFLSPSGFWKVEFESFNQYNAPDGLFDPMDEVDIKGYMQHLKRPPGDEHATDPMLGEKFSFDLTIYEWLQPEDSADGTVKHGHDDGYVALLAGTDAKAPNTGILSYNFGVKGRHTEVFFTPPDAPEPASFLLAGAGLLLALGKRRGSRRLRQ